MAKSGKKFSNMLLLEALPKQGLMPKSSLENWKNEHFRLKNSWLDLTYTSFDPNFAIMTLCIPPITMKMKQF